MLDVACLQHNVSTKTCQPKRVNLRWVTQDHRRLIVDRLHANHARARQPGHNQPEAANHGHVTSS